MRESRSYGSVRGAPGNGRPYRDHSADALTAAVLWARSPALILALQRGYSPNSGTRLHRLSVIRRAL